jgi:uncharacterized protein (TIGR02421 family)
MPFRIGFAAFFTLGQYMLSPNDIDRLNLLSDKYEGLIRPLRIDDYNSAVNRNSEKFKLIEAFNRHIEYNPQFSYKNIPHGSAEPLVQFLRDLDPSANIWEQLLHTEVTRAIVELEAISAHDPDKITAETIHAFGLPSPELVEQAEKILNATVFVNESHNVTASEAGAFLSNALKKSELLDWSVELKQEMNARMMVRSVEKKVYVKADAKFSENSLKRLLVHEIGTHVFRYINGEKQQLRMLRLGMIGYLDTEEGLATYHEKKFGVQDISAIRTYALRAIAASLSLTSSFYSVFWNLSQYSSDLDQIFDIVMRAKRGFIDTRSRGGHVKDQVYLKGLLAITEYLSLHPENYNLVMCGKVSVSIVDELRNLEQSNLLTRPQYLPSNLI